MDWTRSCLAVVPCLNEARAAGGVIRGIQKHLPEVLVVDDGSTDGTAEIARASDAKTLRHPQPLGKGAALRSGLLEAIATGFAWAIMLDGDGQHSPGEIPNFFKAAEQGADLVIGNRMGQCANMPWSRRLANRWSSRLVSARAGIAVPDAQCGFRLVRLAAWQQAGIQARGYEVEAAMILAFARRGLRLDFVTIRTLYGMEQSKFHPLADTWRWLWWWRRQKQGSACAPGQHPVVDEAGARNGVVST